MSEGPIRKCPACGRLKLRRKISRSAFHLKGEGWYVTDYNKNGKKDEDEVKKEPTKDSKSESQNDSSENSSSSAVKEDKGEPKTDGKKKKDAPKKAKAKTTD